MNFVKPTGTKKAFFRVSFSLSRKIIGSFVIVSLLVALTSGLAYTYLTRVDSSYSKLLLENAAVLKQVSTVKEKTFIQNGLLFSYLVDPAKEKELQLNQINTELTVSIKELGSLSGSEEVLSATESMLGSNETFARLVKKVTDYVNQGKPELGKSEALMWAIPTTETLTQAAAQIEELEKQNQDSALAQNRQFVASTIRTLVWVSVFAFLFALAIGILLSRMIVRPMRSMVAAAGRIAACDLTVSDVQVKNKDEIRELATAFNQMKANLHNIISQLGVNANQVAASSEALSANSGQVSELSERITNIVQEISGGTDEQVKSVHMGVSIIEEMSSSVYQIADVSESANRKSLHAQQEAGTGNEAVETAIAQMNSIHLKMRELAESVQRLGERSNQIVNANDLIAGIARQTNLLALNASIEAARAGASGRGFAVVAEEIRKLSMQTSAAAEEVSGLVHSIQEETTEVVQSTEAGTREVATGIEVVNEARAAFKRIRGALNEVAEQIEEVTSQSAAIADKSKSAVGVIRSINEVASQTASGARVVSSNVEGQYASMEEIVSSAAVLNSMADDLKALIGRFRV